MQVATCPNALYILEQLLMYSVAPRLRRLSHMSTSVHCGTAAVCVYWLQVLAGRLKRLEAAVAAERARRQALEADLAAMQQQQQQH